MTCPLRRYPLVTLATLVIVVSERERLFKTLRINSAGVRREHSPPSNRHRVSLVKTNIILNEYTYIVSGVLKPIETRGHRRSDHGGRHCSEGLVNPLPCFPHGHCACAAAADLRAMTRETSRQCAVQALKTDPRVVIKLRT